MKIGLIDNLHPAFKERMEAEGHTCLDLATTVPAALPELLNNVDGIAIRSRISIDEEFLDSVPSLKFIARSGAGMEHVDMLACAQRNVSCYSSPEGNRVAVGEHAVGMLLALMNKICIADTSVRNGTWNREYHRGFELSGKTVGIIGYGRMGTAFAQRLQGFDVTVLAYDKYKKNYSDEFAQEASLEELKAKADVLSIHTPFTQETDRLVNTPFITSFKKPFWFINTARGKIVNTGDLLDALDTGKILGACLDVLEFESSSFQQIGHASEILHRAHQHPNILFTPHVAGWTVESKRKLAEVLADKIIKDVKDGIL